MNRGDCLERHLEHWRAVLAGAPELLDLPADRQRPAVAGTGRGRVVTHVAADLRELGERPVTVLHAAFAALLSRLGAGTDLPIGLALSGGMVVARTDVGGDSDFRELLRRVRDTTLTAYTHGGIPFPALVEALGVRPDTGHHPLFQVLIATESLEEGPATDLTFILQDNGFELHYATDLYDESTVESLAQRLARVLDSVVANPSQRVSEIDLLSTAEREQLLVTWNGAVHTGTNLNAHELVEDHARRIPSAIAVTDGAVELTYAELNARANRLAHKLITRGAGPEKIVAVTLPRSTDLVVALLAVLKSGAAYLPIDLTYPAERITAMVTDSAPALVLTEELLADLDGHRDTNPEVAVSPANPAYVIYTSGSTGRPKGVVIEHRALADYLGWSRRAYPSLTGTSLWHSSVSFDMTVTSLWSSLANGGRVWVTDLRDGEALGCKFLKATPSHLPLLSTLDSRFSPTGELMLGGEALLGEVLDEWRALHPDVPVINV